MFVIIGYGVILGAVLGGYVLAGGHIHSLIQPTEFLTIFGSAIGAFLVANPPSLVKVTLASLPSVLKGSHIDKTFYLNLLGMLYEILGKVRKEGLMSIEEDVENPGASPIFGKYPMVTQNAHAMEFLTDYLRMMVGGNLNAFEIENLMDSEIETHHYEGEAPIHALNKMADGLPAFGIVAAVMGVVHTMQSVGLPPAELGKLIAAALVGTFLGILLSYGFVGPVGTAMEHKLHDEGKVFQCIKVVLLASMNGYAPQVAVEFGRKVLFSPDRPTFPELEKDLKSRKSR